MDVVESDGPDRSSSPQSATYVWVLPERSWSLRPARWVLSGWQLSGVTSFVSGDATDITGTPSQGARVVLTGDPVLPKGERTFSRNFNTGVVQAPAVGTIGSAARTNIRGPGMNNLDLSLQKNHTQFSGLDIFGEFTGVEKRFGCDYLLATNQEHWPQMNADKRR